MSLTIGSLCSGAGMLDEGVRSVLGGEIAWHAEWEPATEKNPNPRQAALRVLMHRYPGVENLGDLTTVDWHAVEPVDVLTAGYPCQPDSSAGKRLSEDDHRWIFPDIARAIGVLRPRLVVLENVQGHFVRGFRAVLGSLAAIGFDADWTLVRASDVGAPHRRERLFVVAWPAGDAHGPARGEWWLAASGQAQGGWSRADACRPDRVRAVADTASSRREGGDRESSIQSDLAGSALTNTERVGRTGRTSEPLGGPVRGVATTRDRQDAATDTDRDALRQQPVTERRGSSQALAGLSREAATDAACGSRSDRPVRRGSAGQHERAVTGASGRDRTGDAAARVRDMGGTAPVLAAPAWGQYEAAIRRWERVLDRLAPAPTETGPKGGQRLSPRFVEWLMGWPDGWVTDVPQITRNDALRICGNGVVPQQAAEALRRLLSLEAVA